MRTKRTCLIFILTLTGLFLSVIEVLPQQTADQLYEKALYLEEARGELQGSIDLYTQVINSRDADRSLQAKALLHMGMCYEKLGSEQARKLYREVISKYSDYTEEADLASQRMKRLDAYVAELDQKAEEHMKKGNEFFKLWDYESAVQEYKNAIKLRPNTLLALNAQYCIGQSWYRAGKYEEALASFTDLIKENPRSTIAPVTELMLSQVQYAMENSEHAGTVQLDSDEDTIVDPKTGISYRKTKTLAGKNDQIGYLSGGANMSPDCRFMVLENKVVPLDGGDPFDLVDMAALRAIYAPNMKKAAFFADSAIWIVPVSPETGRTTGQPSRLLDGGYIYEGPVNWSPDGERIAITRDEKDIELDIWTISVTGGELQRITDSPDIETSPCWSPDGNKIAYRKGAEIWLASTNGKDHSIILKQGGGVPFRWSSDNKWLVLQSMWKNDYLLYSFELHKNYEFSVPERVGKFVSFSPEGKRMVFYRPSHEDKWPLKIVSSSGGASYKPAGNEAAYGSTWMWDSKQIIVQGADEQRNVTMKIISLSGGSPKNIKIEADVGGKPFPFKILPDYKHIAFSVDRDSGRHDLYIAPFSVQEARTVGPAQLIFEDWSGGAYNVTTSWSPDGKKLALSHEGDIWVIPLETGNPIQITDTPDEERWVDWSPDGQLISYKIFNQSEKVETLYVIQPGEDSSTVIHHNCQRESIWTSDSESIILFSDGDLLRISLDGTLLEHILNIKDLGIGICESPCLSPDGKHLAFIGYESGDRDRSLIIKYSFNSKKITRLAEDDPYDYKYSLSWSPDGKWISYLTYEEIKVRPEGYFWEADFEEVKEKLVSRE